MEHMVSGVGVLDKSMRIVSVVSRAGARGSRLTEIISGTGIPKPTAHRLVVALETHDLLRRRDDGRYTLGIGLVELGRRAGATWPIAEIARPFLADLRRETGESTQLYVREGDVRICLISFESSHELRTIVAEGARLTLEAGSAGRILRGRGSPAAGWTASVGERQAGVASVSAGVTIGDEIVAAVGVSGPTERLGGDPGPLHGPAVVAAADRIARALGTRRSSE